MTHPIKKIRLVPESRLVHLDEIMKEDMILKFPCKFDENGLCDGVPQWAKTLPKCCCHSCTRNIGYLNFRTERTTKIYKNAWDDLTGFWKDGIGCTLPRKYRSLTCLCYLCDTHRSKPKNKEYVQYLKNLSDHLDVVRSLIWESAK